MEEMLVKSKDISIEFANAALQKNIEHIEYLLSDEGTFNIQDNELETQDANKEQFIKWFGQKIEKIPITKIDFDQCLHCMIGNKVVLFNDGMFPRIVKDISERSKTGLMLDIKDGKIFEIAFCYVFARN